jgi:peroxiredoxin
MNATRLALVIFLGLGFAVWIVIGRGGDRKPMSGQPRTAAKATVPAPELMGATDWVNSKPLKLADQKGKVVIVHFWTNGCINCVHNYPRYRAWTEMYKDNKNLVIVGIHTPETDDEKDVNRIKDRAAKYDLTFPIAVDNDGAIWNAWGNRAWPSVYLVDKAGNIRHHWEGELGDEGYKTVTGLIDELLAERPANEK